VGMDRYPGMGMEVRIYQVPCREHVGCGFWGMKLCHVRWKAVDGT
jgi:hypothetical protein